MIEELLDRTFRARNFAHMRHLGATSYAQHMALGAFYDAIIPAVDAIAETWMGLGNPKIEDFAVGAMKPAKMNDTAEYLQAEADWLEENREELSMGNSAIGNLIDNLTGLYLGCVYKLENLA